MKLLAVLAFLGVHTPAAAVLGLVGMGAVFMGLLFEAVTAQNTHPTGLAAATIVATDPTQVRAFQEDLLRPKAWLIGFWGLLQAAGTMQFLSTRMHDAVSNFYMPHQVSTSAPPNNVFPQYQRTPIYSTDTISYFIASADAAGNIETVSAAYFYQDVPGLDSRLITESYLDEYSEDVMTCSSSIVAGTTGGYSGATALSSFTIGQGVLYPNRDYALVGWAVDGNCATVTIKGPDTGQARIPMIGNAVDKKYTSTGFVRWNRESGFPTIPIINQASKSGTIIELVNNQAALTVQVTLIFQLLKAGHPLGIQPQVTAANSASVSTRGKPANILSVA